MGLEATLGDLSGPPDVLVGRKLCLGPPFSRLLEVTFGSYIQYQGTDLPINAFLEPLVQMKRTRSLAYKQLMAG